MMRLKRLISMKMDIPEGTPTMRYSFRSAALISKDVKIARPPRVFDFITTKRNSTKRQP